LGEMIEEKKDVLDRSVLTEDRLRYSEEKFRSFVEQSSDGIVLIDERGFVVEWNHGEEELTGLGRADALGRPIWDVQFLLLPDDRKTPGIYEELKSAILAVLRAGQSSWSRQETEVEIQKIDGTRRIIQTAVFPIKTSSGLMVGSISRDSTERKGAEEALRRRAEELAALQATALDIAGQQDLPTLLHTIVERAAKLLRGMSGGIYLCDPEKRKLRLVASYNPPRDYTGTELKYGDGAAGRVAQTGEPLIVDDYRNWPGRAAAYEESKELFTAVLSVPMIWQGQVTGVIYVLDNVESRHFTQADQELLTIFANHAAISVERKKMEEAVRGQADLLQKTLNSMTDAIFILEAKVPPTAPTILECNEAASAVFGYGRTELLGKTTDFLHVSEDTLKEFQSQLYSAVQQGRLPFHLHEFRMKRKDGSIFPSEHSVSQLLNDKGERTGWVSIVRDITERKRMQEELQQYSTQLEGLVFERTRKLAESERRFRELADLLPQIVFEIDDNGNLQFMNRAAFAATGLTEEDLRRGLNAFCMFAQEDHERAMRGIRRTMAGETIGGREFTALRRDGTTFPVLVYTAPIMREGKTVGLRGIAIDITERKHTEQKLRDSEERFRGIAERSIDGIFELDLEGRVTYVSPSVQRALGYKPEEVIGTRMERYLPESEFPKIAPNMAALMKGMNVLGVQGEMLGKDGTRISAELNASPIFKDGRVVGVQGIVRDITERTKMEKALRESEERYRRLMESMSEHIAVLDSEWRYLLANEALTRSVKIRAVQLLGKKLTEVFPGIEKSPFFEAGERVMKHRKPAAVTSEHIFEDGRRGWFESHIYPVPEGIMYVANDVTDRKRMEEELAKSQRLAAIGETAAIVGHDLRNPLQGIASTVYLAKRILKFPKAEERKKAAKLLDTLDEEVYYMDKIVSDLQSYAGPLAAEPVETNLPDLIRRTLSGMRVPRNVKVSMMAQKGLSKIVADPALMRRVLTNLAANALQAMPQGGRLTIRAFKKRETITITVQDTGEGIPRENMEKIFSPFFTTKAKGQGLGLAVCRRLVEAQGGTITVKSKVGKGSVFTLQIAAREKPGVT
jgi:PAS domain S-box-containing protein